MFIKQFEVKGAGRSVRKLQFLRFGFLILVFFAAAPCLRKLCILNPIHSFANNWLSRPLNSSRWRTARSLSSFPKPSRHGRSRIRHYAADVHADFFVERVRDIINFKKSENVLQIGNFSNPPRLEDLAELTLDQVDIDAIEECRVGVATSRCPRSS